VTSTASKVPDGLDAGVFRLAMVMALGAGASALDTTIVVVAVDRIARQFDVGVATVQWVSTSYLLAIAMALPVTGWAVDRFGARRMWLLTLGTFLVSSALCGAAWSMASLIAFRVCQGIGGGMIPPLAQTILVRAAGRDRIGRAMTVISVPTQFAPVLGPVLGGLVVNGLGWRWAFYINVPICVLGILLSRRWIPADPEPLKDRLDVTELLLLSLGLAATIYGLTEAGENANAVLPLVTGVALLAGFAFHSLRVGRSGTTPLIDVRLLRSRTFGLVSALMFLLGVSIFGTLFLLPLYYQQVRGAGPLEAGLLLAPQGAGVVMSLMVVGRLTDRIGARPVVLAGLVIGVIGTLPYTQVSSHPWPALLLAALLVRGVGLGAIGIPLVAAVYQAGLPEGDVPRAMSALNIAQRLGGSFGTAVLAIILQRALTGHSPAAAYGMTIWWTVVFGLIALIPALCLPSRARQRAAGSRPI